MTRKKSEDVAGGPVDVPGGFGSAPGGSAGALGEPGAVETTLEEWTWPAAGQMGFIRPTPVQSEMVPAVLAGGDVVVGAPSGTGRAAGVALAAMKLLERDPATRPTEVSRPLSVLVVAFTAEDVLAVASALEGLSGSSAGVVAAHSGVRADRVAAALRRGATCLVGTPGRVVDLAGKGALNAGHLRMAAILEADLMASLGATDGLAAILKAARPASADSLQVVVVGAQQPGELEEFIGQALVSPRRLSFPAVNAGLAALTPHLREVAEDAKLDVAVRAMANAAETSRGVLVARTEQEADEVRAALTRGEDGVSVEVLVDGSEESAAALASGRPLLSLHLPLDPAAWAEASLNTASSILVSPAEYWDLARLGLLERRRRPGGSRRQPARGRKRKDAESKAGEQTVVDRPVAEPEHAVVVPEDDQAVADDAVVEAPERRPKKSGRDTAGRGATEAERLQRRYALRDASRKIECIDPEDATKEAARLVQESLREAAFQQAFGPAASETGEPSAEALAEAEERRRAEALRRREVDERLREVKRRLSEQEGLAAWRAPEDKPPADVAADVAAEKAPAEDRAAALDRIPADECMATPAAAAEEHAGPAFELLSEEEARLVAWAREARERVGKLVGRERTRPEYAVLAEFLLERGEARQIISALLEEVVPLPTSVPRHDGGMTRLFVSIGRTARVTRDQVEELLIERAGLCPDDIGRIDVFARYTFLEVRESLADLVIERLSGCQLRGREMVVARAKPPKNGNGDSK